MSDDQRKALGDEEILTRVHVAALNRADILNYDAVKSGTARRGAAKPGMEWAGEVIGVGRGVTSVVAGDRVMCSGSGGFAPTAVAHQARTIRLASDIDDDLAAGLPLGLLTMHDAIVTHGKAAAGQTMLIQGGAAGVGLIGLQIGRLKGCSAVIAATRGNRHGHRLLELGATHAIDSHREDWPEQVRAATGDHGADVVIDLVSGDKVAGNLVSAAILGRIVNVGRLGGNQSRFDPDLHALKRVSYIGVTFRTRSIAEVAAIQQAMLADIGDAVMAGAIRPPIDSSVPLDDLDAAFDRMRSNAHFGKILVRMPA